MPTTTPQEMEKVLSQWKSVLEKQPKESLLRPRVDGQRALELSLLLESSFQEKLSEIDDQLSSTLAKQIKRQIQEIVALSKSFYAADLLRGEKLSSQEGKRLKELTQKNRKHDDELFTWAWPLFRKDESKKELLLDIRSGRSHLDDAEDVLRLVNLYRSEWKTVKSLSPYTETELNQAAEEATEQLTLLQRNQENTPDGQLLYKQAFTYWHNTYNELKSTGRFLCRNDKDANTKFPGIGNKRTPNSEKNKETTPDTPVASPEQ